MRVFLWIGPLALLASVLLWARFGNRPEDAPVPEEPTTEAAPPSDRIELTESKRAAAGIEVCPCSRATLPEELTTTGVMEMDADRVAHVGSRLPGIVYEVSPKATLGARVAKGDVLLSIDSTEFGRAQVDFLKAIATLDAREKTYAREKDLFDQKIGSGREFIGAEAELAQARVELQAARNQLEVLGLSDGDVQSFREGKAPLGRLTLRAPVGGTVIEKHVVQGEHVDTESNLFTIADLGHVWLLADVYERDIPRIAVGQRAEVLVAAHPDHPFIGVMSVVRDTMDAETRTLKVKVDIDNKEGALKPGMFATVRLTLSERKDVLTVPESAIQVQGKQEIVFVETASGVFERREVHTGLRHEGRVELLDGVREGEKVVASGGYLLVSELDKGSFEGD